MAPGTPGLELRELDEGEHGLTRPGRHDRDEPRPYGTGVGRLVVDAVAARLPEGLAAPEDTGGAVGALYAAVALELLGVAVPTVDLDTRGALAAHLQALYGPYGVPAPDASVVVAYLATVGLGGMLLWLATIWVVRRGWRWARPFATAALLVALAVAGADLAVSEYGVPILPTWLGLVGLLPCLAGLVAVVLLWRRGTGPLSRT